LNVKQSIWFSQTPEVKTMMRTHTNIRTFPSDLLPRFSTPVANLQTLCITSEQSSDLFALAARPKCPNLAALKVQKGTSGWVANPWQLRDVTISKK
jgi:hypothetical protein